MDVKSAGVHPKHRWLIAVVLLPLAGCWWQRDGYTDRMRGEMARFEKRAEFDRLLGPAFEGPAEFSMWIRPPKETVLRALPAEAEGVLVALFQSETSPIIEFAIIGSVGPESLSDFQQKAFADLAKVGKGPGVELKRQEPAMVSCMHGGDTTFEVFSQGGARQMGAGAPTNYQWVCYVVEEGTQKVMLAFIIPDANYSAFGEPMTKCLESLAMSSKVSAARSGVSTGPATPAAAPGSGAAANF